MPVYPIRLAGERTCLREFQPTDVDDVAAIVGDEQVTTWLSFDRRDHAEAAELVAGTLKRARREPREEFYLAITRRGDDRLIGFARLALTGVRAGKLGYAVAADHWGHGYATDAVRQLLRFAFETVDLHRVSAAIGPDNQASVAVVKRLGLTYEGRIRHHVRTNGEWRDSLLYAILADDWARLTAADLVDPT